MASRGAPRRRGSSTPYERPQGPISHFSDHSSVLQSEANIPKTKGAVEWREVVVSGSSHKGSACDSVWEKDKFRISNFRTHFIRKHPQLSLERGYITSPSATITTSDQLNLIVSRWILTSNRPFNIVEDDDLRTLIHGLNPSLTLLHRKQLMRTHLPRFYLTLKDQVS